jgi:hypothetical protein
MNDVPVWVWIMALWLLVSVCFACAVGRWFRFLRDEDAEERRNAHDWHG